MPILLKHQFKEEGNVLLVVENTVHIKHFIKGYLLDFTDLSTKDSMSPTYILQCLLNVKRQFKYNIYKVSSQEVWEIC